MTSMETVANKAVLTALQTRDNLVILEHRCEELGRLLSDQIRAFSANELLAYAERTQKPIEPVVRVDGCSLFLSHLDVYIVAIQQSGSACVTSSEAFLKYSDAETELKKDRDKGINYTRIFTLHCKE